MDISNIINQEFEKLPNNYSLKKSDWMTTIYPGESDLLMVGIIPSNLGEMDMYWSLEYKGKPICNIILTKNGDNKSVSINYSLLKSHKFANSIYKESKKENCQQSDYIQHSAISAWNGFL